ncbi:MAG: translation elongation factor Ts [Bacteroidota bacterium]|nr:translation elongation factor Ts [Bacteroidota bacterium]
MAISAAQVNELRQKTGAGMMDCKKALTEADGNFEKAIEVLRKKGAAVAAKRAEKTANEGIVLTKISQDEKTGYIVEVNCETDFVAKSNDFTGFTDLVMNTIIEKKPSNVDELNAIPEVNSALQDLMGKVGEKIQVTRFAVENAPNGYLTDYIHPGAKLAVLVKFDNVINAAELAPIAKDVAMQIAAMKPLCVYREEVPTNLIEKEIEIYKEIAKKEGKPEQILEKIAQGKLNKFYSENCLAEQAYIKDNSKSVNDLFKEYNSKNSSTTKIVNFKRFHLGDENK